MTGRIDRKLQEVRAVVFPRGIARHKLLRVGEFDRVEADNGRVIAREGTNAQWVYVVLSGRIDEVRANRLCRRCGPGDIVGDAPVLSGRPWPHAAVAVGRTRLLAIPASRFPQLLAEIPELGGTVMRSLSARLVAAESAHGVRRPHHRRIAPA